MKQKNSPRRLIWLSTFLVFFGQSSIAQTLRDFFNDGNVPLMYLGIDFTRTKLIDDANANTQDIKDRQYAGLNEIIVQEAKKYDVKKAFRRNNSVDHDLGPVEKRNQTIDMNQIKSTNTSDFHRFNADSVAAVVSQYDFSGKKGIGLLIVMEALSKSEKMAASWYTFVDMSTKKVLATDRIESKVGGGGPPGPFPHPPSPGDPRSDFYGNGWRNYWASTVRNAIEMVEKSRYNEWKGKFGN
jgi:hypothetical protein